MSDGGDILCSRCGTPFPKERGKVTVTCVVCGQLRPDLDMTLEDEPEAPVLAPPKPKSNKSHAMAETPPLRVMRPATLPPALPKATMASSNEPNYSAMELPALPDLPEIPDEMIGGPSLAHRLGPIVLGMSPFIAGFVCAMYTLQIAPDFSQGSLLASLAVLVLVGLAALFVPLLLDTIFFAARLRGTWFLRTVFVLCVSGICYSAFREIPKRIIFRPNDLPAVRIHQ